jgi:hypothetical protein
MNKVGKCWNFSALLRAGKKIKKFSQKHLEVFQKVQDVFLAVNCKL